VAFLFHFHYEMRKPLRTIIVRAAYFADFKEGRFGIPIANMWASRQKFNNR